MITTRIVAWNANGLTERRHELEAFLSLNKIDIALISETRFTRKSNINFKNYTIYTTNHPSGNSHGGSAIIIKSNIKHYPLKNYISEKTQATIINIQEKNTETTIAAIYSPPRHVITTNDFETIFSHMGNRFICGGDWNAKHTYWGSRLTTPRGRQLFQTIQRFNLKCVSSREPTYWPSDHNKVPDLIDFFVTKNIPDNNVTVESNIDLSSDHTPIILNVWAKPLLTETPMGMYNNTTNWQKFQEKLDSGINLKIPLKSQEQIEDAIGTFSHAIHKAAYESTKKHTKLLSKHNRYPIFIREKIAERRRLRRVWHNTGYPSDKTAFNKASHALKRIIKTTENDNFQKMLSDLTGTKETNYSLWKVTKKLKRPQLQIPPVKDGDNNWAKTSLEKATAFAKHLHQVFQPLPSKHPDHDEDVQTYLDTPLQLCYPIRHVTPNELRKEINNLPSQKSPGYDMIDATILKQLPHKGIMFLLALFNACIRLTYFPSQWKIAQVVMILKPGKRPDEIASYRPISLLPIMGKMLEHIILNRMRKHLSDIIPEHQFGFRENHGTMEQIHRITDVIGRTFENNSYCSAVFLDIEQAFDRVWHSGLLYKIKKFLPHSFYHILNSYLEHRCFEVKYNNESSSLYSISSGIPQGSILGPVLYLIFTADIPTDPKTTMATYADDTALLSIDEKPEVATENLQTQITSLETWFNRWRIKVNQSKSVHVTFTLKRQTCPPVNIYSVNIPQAEEAKYLGMHLDRRLTWRKHIWTKRKQLDTKVRSMYWLIGNKSKLSNRNKILLYKVILKPIWTYGIQLWGTASNSNIDILERFQCKTLRSMLNIPFYIANKYIYEDLQLKTIREEIAEYSKKYQRRLQLHPNELAANLTGDGSVQHIRLRRHDMPSLTQRFRDV